MPGTVKVWWHDGATKDVRYNELPVVNEPELGYEPIAVSATPASTTTQPPLLLDQECHRRRPPLPTLGPECRFAAGKRTRLRAVANAYC